MSTCSHDVIVLGAGAAGMMCAAHAGQRGRRVLLIDHARLIGEKIRISGGGRCNFTNLRCRPENFLSQNPDFCRSALARYTAADFIALVERHGIAYHEKEAGQLFCDGSATQIIEMLKSECALGGVQWRTPCEIQSVARMAEIFRVATNAGSFEAPALVIATGGLSVPKIGASPFGYRVAAQFGLEVVSPRPALVPLSFAPEFLAHYGELSGVSVDAEVACNPGRFRGKLLFTHRGMSGPVILQISSYWSGKELLDIDLLPERTATAWIQKFQSRRAGFDTVLAEVLPRRLAQCWCSAQGSMLPIERMAGGELRGFVEGLKHWCVKPAGTLGYNKAEVTLGGVDTAGLSSKTMEAHAVPGLYFIGEVVDVTGHLGGFNFQWAWSSAVAAGNAA